MKKEIRDKIEELEAEETLEMEKLEKLIIEGGNKALKSIRRQRRIISEIKARIRDLLEMS